jgi:hypothetical protein
MRRRTTTAVLASAVLGIGATSCGFEGEDPVVEVEDIPVGTTYVELDSGFLEALQSLELTPGPVGSTAIENGSARFPITGGNVTYYEPGTEDPYVQGEIDHQGSGLSLESDDTTVALTDFEVDPGDSELTGTVWANGEIAEEEASLFFLDGRTLEPLRPVDDGAVLEGTTVRLTQEAADLLNATFGTEALESGLEIGVAKIVVRTEP